MSIVAIVENGVIKLPPELRIPDGTAAEVTLRPNTGTAAEGSFFDSVRDLIGSVDGPSDWAAEHDHYIHGSPKRNQE